MSADVYKEQLITRKSDEKDMLKKIVIAAVGVTLSCASVVFYGPMPSTVIVFIICFIIYKIYGRFNVEYEYIYTNGSLDIDCIYNKEKRKRKYSATVSEFEMMAHIDDERLKEFEQLPKIDFSSGDILGNTYVFIGKYKGKRARIVFEPNEEILSAMNIDLTPRKLFRKK